jgi:hypothetical protein
MLHGVCVDTSKKVRLQNITTSLCNEQTVSATTLSITYLIAFSHHPATCSFSAAAKRPRSSTTPPSSRQVKRMREGEYNRFVSTPPSDAARYPEFRKRQEAAGGPMIYCNRPPLASSIPVTLLHPILGKFVDECCSYIPTKEDNAFVLELSTEMSGFFDSEECRRTSFITMLEKHCHIQLIAGEVGKGYRTDGHRLSGGCMDLLTEAKIELAGVPGAEPYFQGCVYYRESSKLRNAKDFLSPLPCLLIFYCGNIL